MAFELLKGRGFCVWNARGLLVSIISFLMGQPLLFSYLQCSIYPIENTENARNLHIQKR